MMMLMGHGLRFELWGHHVDSVEVIFHVEVKHTPAEQGDDRQDGAQNGGMYGHGYHARRLGILDPHRDVAGLCRHAGRVIRGAALWKTLHGCLQAARRSDPVAGDVGIQFHANPCLIDVQVAGNPARQLGQFLQLIVHPIEQFLVRIVSGHLHLQQLDICL
jgi:hypothetical protein